MSAPANALFLVLSELRHHWKNFPVTYMLVFIEVAQNELAGKEVGILEVGESIGIPGSTVSRAIIELSPRTIPSGNSEPIDFLATKPDPFDHRKRIPFLTQKGRRVFGKLMRIMETANPSAVVPPPVG